MPLTAKATSNSSADKESCPSLPITACPNLRPVQINNQIYVYLAVYEYGVSIQYNGVVLSNSALDKSNLVCINMPS